MKQVRRVVLSMAALAVALGALAGVAVAKPASKPKGPGKATAAPGELDTTFGVGGKVTVAFPAENAGSAGPKYTLPFEFTPGHLEMAKAPGGKIVIAGATKIVRYLAERQARPDLRYRRHGRRAAPARSALRPRRRRRRLAGPRRPRRPLAADPERIDPGPGAEQSDRDALQRRRLDRHQLRQQGGMVITDFGFKAPAAAGGPYIGASVGLRDVTIDVGNRPVVSGGYVTELTK